MKAVLLTNLKFLGIIERIQEYADYLNRHHKVDPKHGFKKARNLSITPEGYYAFEIDIIYNSAYKRTIIGKITKEKLFGKWKPVWK